MNGLSEVITYLPERLSVIIQSLPDYISDEIYEIRLRSYRPVIIFCSSGTMFIKTDGSVCRFFNNDCILAEQNEITQTVDRLCVYSVYAHQNDIAKGFLTFGKGHRAGFSGTAVVHNNQITAIRNIDGINIRIAKNIKVETSCITDLLATDSLNGLIICGPPCSGKTTLLRNIAEKCSSSFSAGYKKTVVVDERSELGTINGLNCDILRGFSKYDGIIYSTRVLSPDIIICDEICEDREASEIVKCCYSGIKFILSIYADCGENVFCRSVGKILAESGFFDHVIFLDRQNLCKEIEMHKMEDLYSEYLRNNTDNG